MFEFYIYYSRNKILHTINLKSKTIFLIDSLGAALTTIILLVVVKKYNNYFKMPIAAINVLSIISALMAVYSFLCFTLFNTNLRTLLKIIIVANICYSVSTFILVIYFYHKLTVLGLVYFIAEIIIISSIINLELNIVNDKKKLLILK